MAFRGVCVRKAAQNGRLWGFGSLRIVIGHYIHCQNAGIVLFLFENTPDFQEPFEDENDARLLL